MSQANSWSLVTLSQALFFEPRGEFRCGLWSQREARSSFGTQELDQPVRHPAGTSCRHLVVLRIARPRGFVFPVEDPDRAGLGEGAASPLG